MMLPQDLIGPDTAAAILGVSRQTIHANAKSGRIPVAMRTPGGIRRFSRRAIEALRDQLLGVAPSSVRPSSAA